MTAPAEAPSVETLPPPGQLALHALLVPLWGACNPLALSAALVLSPSHALSSNVIAWSPAEFLLLGAATALFLLGALYALLRATNAGKASAARLAWGIHVAQLPFLPFLALAWLAFEGMEGNIIGFIIVPATLLWLIVSVPAFLALLVFWVLRARKAHAQGPTPASAA